MAFPNSLPALSFVCHCEVSKINAAGCPNPHSKLCLLICRHQHHVLLSGANISGLERVYRFTQESYPDLLVFGAWV